MALIIRKAGAGESESWMQLVRQVLGSDAGAEQVYDLDRLRGQLSGPQVEETWLAEMNGTLRASISVLGSETPNNNPVANLGRYLATPESYSDGSAEALISGINEVCSQRKQIAVIRVPVSDNAQQKLVEKLGYVCAGFQPLKHLCMVREGMLFYLKTAGPDSVARYSLSQSLPQIAELGSMVLKNLQLANPEMVRDGLTGYPIHADLSVEEATPEDYDACRLDAQSSSPPLEIFGQFNRGRGMLRVANDPKIRVLLGQRDARIVAGLCYYFDENDKCMRLVDSFATDDLSTGAMLCRAVEIAQEKHSAVYIEVDFLMSAPRILKSAEQLGFVPAAYLPGFFNWNDCGIDLVKMVKLNAPYNLDNAKLTPQARAVLEIVDRNFQDQKTGVAVINLLRALPIFNGLGDGELGKMARLFSQKLYRTNEKVFSKGDSSNEAYVVMRGKIDVYLEDNGKPVASVSSGAIIGEQAFLDGASRNAFAIAAQPTILLVVQRPAFNVLVQSEPHLGMVIMRNVALEVSNKLRKTDAALTTSK
jgi:hypothetical protein